MKDFYDQFYDDHTCVFTTQHNSFPALPSGGTYGVFFERPWWIIIPFRDIFLPNNLSVFSQSHKVYTPFYMKWLPSFFSQIQNKIDTPICWEGFWSAYLLFDFIEGNTFKYNYLRENKYADLRKLVKKFLRIKKLPEYRTSGDTVFSRLILCCRSAYNEPRIRLAIKDAIAVIDQLLKSNEYILYFQVTTGLYGDTEPITDLQKQILTGLFHLEQSCKAAGLNRIKFKIFLSQNQWDGLIFDNKSHYTGRDWIV